MPWYEIRASYPGPEPSPMGLFGGALGRAVGIWADPGRVWARWMADLARSTGVHSGLFVDLGPIFQYSKVLARCCAWGLGVLTRTV